MRLPELQNLLIQRTKIVEYLLNPAHPENGGKAAFFQEWGFAASNWTIFAEGDSRNGRPP